MTEVDAAIGRRWESTPGFYALLAGVVFLVLAGVMLAPVIHHVLQRFHLEANDAEDNGERTN